MVKCQISGKSWMKCNRISNSNIKTKYKLKVNIQNKRVFNIESGKWIRMKISMRELRTLNKKYFRFELKV